MGFKYDDNMNMLGIITFCIAFGIIIGQLREKAEILMQFFVSLNDVTMRLISVIMW